MGCDIHMYMEWRYKGGEWQSVPEITIEPDEDGGRVRDLSATGRNYELFADLAGVRGEGPDPKGLPEDVSPLIARSADEWDCDGHSHSYCSIEEFEEILKRHSESYDLTDKSTLISWDWKEYGYGPDEKEPPQDYVPLINYGKKLKEEMSKIDAILLGGTPDPNDIEVRLVFWFDN